MKVEFQCTDSTLSHLEISTLLNTIDKYTFVTKVACLPPYVSYIKKKIENKKISSIIDFPLGVLDTNQKLDIIKSSIDAGATSIEIVMPSFLINNNQHYKLKSDIEKCYGLCIDRGVNLHYILEYRSYNYSCLYRLIKKLMKFDLNEIYISTGHQLDDIYDHLIAIGIIRKEISDLNIVCNANIYNENHLDLLKKHKIEQFRVKSVHALEIVSQKRNFS